MRLRRERSCSVEIPGSTRWSSTKRLGPAARSRMISSVHLSPTRSSARASGDHWSYGCRLGGGGPGMGGTSVCPNSGGVGKQHTTELVQKARSSMFFRFLTPEHKFGADLPFEVSVGELIQLDEHRRAREAGGQRPRTASSLRAEFFFDLACPFSYL